MENFVTHGPDRVWQVRYLAGGTLFNNPSPNINTNQNPNLYQNLYDVDIEASAGVLTPVLIMLCCALQ